MWQENCVIKRETSPQFLVMLYIQQGIHKKKG
jgi:hypothetical protein